MSAGLQTANVVDLAAYRARRDRGPTAARAQSASPVMFGVLPIMVPVVAWIPVWQLSPAARLGDAINE